MRFLDAPAPLVVVLGPTAVGKTEIALKLAERLNGEIVSADSRLFYRGMDIGTAKPTQEELARVPHHLVDVANPDETWSLAIFQERANQAIQDIQNRGRLPFLVGGTGQYLKAVTEAWEPPALEPDLQMRKALEDWAGDIGAGGLHTRLSLIDPQAAARIEPRNLRRTVRALEVIFHTGRRFSEQRQKGTSPYQILRVGLTRPRDELYARIDERILGMVGAGLVEEVRNLLAQGYSPELPTLSAIGYREIVAYLEGRCTFEEALGLIRRQTRAFVRRQANWFKESDPDIHWFTAKPQTVDEVEKLIRLAEI